METVEIKKILTHDGFFHADEVFAVAWLRYNWHFFDVPLIRTRDKGIIEAALSDPNICVIDVGSTYDVKMLNFDHHQSPDLDASNMLVCREFIGYRHDVEECAEVIKNIMQGVSDWDTNKNDIVNRFSNEYPGIQNISQMIAAFNIDPRNPEIQDEVFGKAVDFAIIIIMNAFENAKRAIEARKNYANHSLTKDGIPIWEEFCGTWKDTNEFKYSIQPNPQGWALLAANSTENPLPTADAIKEVAPNLIFAHIGRFIAVFKTKEEAIAVAEAMLLNL